MNDVSIVEEMLFNSKWLTKEYKDSKVYRDYIKKCSNELIQQSYANR